MYTRRLAEYINASSGIVGITAYAESAPAAKTTSPQLVIVANAGQSGFTGTTFYSNCRFMVSGTAASSIEKAEELFRFFCPFGIPNNAHRPVCCEYGILRTIPDGEPTLASNQGNVFWASFSLSFKVARDS